jgi:hypothetical protein
MMQNRKGLIVLAAAVMAFGTVLGQAFEKEKFASTPADWELSAITGYFTGERVFKGKVDGVPVKATTDGGWLVGVRFGADQEYLGWEVGFSGVFQNLDVNGDVSDLGLPSSGDASWLLGNVNALLFPFGNAIAEGRVKPFMTAGPGIAYLLSDFDRVDGEMALDLNVGFGIKFQLGEQRNPTLRIDYRWHYMTAATGDLEDNIFHQEISAGIGIRF